MTLHAIDVVGGDASEKLSQVGVEVCVEVVSRRPGSKGGRHGQPPLGIERDNHGGIYPTHVTRPRDFSAVPRQVRDLEAHWRLLGLLPAAGSEQ